MGVADCVGNSNVHNSPVPKDHVQGCKSAGYYEGLSPTCMGTNPSVGIPDTEDHAQGNDDGGAHVPIENLFTSGNEDREAGNINLFEREDREVVGPVGKNSEHVCEDDGNFGGLDSDFPRPSYITRRPNKTKAVHKVAAHSHSIPDLNYSAGVDDSSDPFNIGEIFRMEAGAYKGEGMNFR
ncbi:hypothetical protein Hanom_Chr16g01446881 [Helianthus anomalus]